MKDAFYTPRFIVNLPWDRDVAELRFTMVLYELQVQIQITNFKTEIQLIVITSNNLKPKQK